MVKHIVAWDYKDGFSEAENEANAQKIKAGLESLVGLIHGIFELNVYICTLPSSHRDVVLHSLFESEEALASYQVHPQHKAVSEFVGTVMQNRVCIDYHV